MIDVQGVSKKDVYEICFDKIYESGNLIYNVTFRNTVKNKPLVDGQTNRYHSIDFLKVICILFIIVTHYTWEDSERLKYLFPFWINMAVPTFMIISGFVYTRSFLKKDINTSEKAYRIRNILGKIIF